MMKKNKRTFRAKIKKLCLTVLSATIALPLLTPIMQEMSVEAEDIILNNPCIVADDYMESGQNVTWDCVYFGNYPQAEVIPSGEYTFLDKSILRKGDVIVSDSVYQVLRNAQTWDDNNEVVYQGSRYRRMKKEDAVSVNWGIGNYQWDRFYGYRETNENAYHYFKYEPIKWRVLYTDGEEALLLADKALDNRTYYYEGGKVTWETSAMRSWLNGYSGEQNESAVDYSRNNFINSAFTEEEQSAINPENDDAAEEDNVTEDYADFVDKISLLSEEDVCNTECAETYGFVRGKEIDDNARRCKSSTYAKAMGVWSSSNICFVGNCYWWLKKPTCDLYLDVGNQGEWHSTAADILMSDLDSSGIRPVLNLDLSLTDFYSYAGTVSSDGRIGTKKQEDELNPPETQKVSIGQITNMKGLKYKVTKVYEDGTGEVTLLKAVDKDFDKRHPVLKISDSICIDGKMFKVSAVGNQAFSHSEQFKTVVIGDNVTEIGSKAFYKCVRLKKVIIPTKVNKIGRKAFCGCKRLRNINIKTKRLTGKKIGEKAFKAINTRAKIKVPKRKLKVYRRMLRRKGVGLKVKIN